MFNTTLNNWGKIADFEAAEYITYTKEIVQSVQSLFDV